MKGFLSGIGVLIGFASFCHATSFYERPFSEAVEDAPVVVRGKIGPSTTKWSMGIDGTKRIYTYTELQIDEVFKGDVKGHTLTMRELGGEKDGVGMQVSGTAQFNPGEDTVVFLDQSHIDEGGSAPKDEYYDVRGMMMGKFNVVRPDNGKEYLVGAGITATDHPVLRSQNADGRWTIGALRELIQTQTVLHEKAALERKKSAEAPASPVPTKNPAESVSASSQAPGLQTSAAEADHGPGMLFWAVLALVSVAILSFMRFRK